MKKYNLAFALFPFLLAAVCACKQETPKSDADVVDHDTADTLIDLDVVPDGSDKDGINSDDVMVDDDSPLLSDDETPDVDMFCPSPAEAGYPYHREDGSIHFCRPCDLPADDFDPDCVRSLWKDTNKKIYDTWVAGEFTDNANVNECYPYPCEWNVKPIPPNENPDYLHQCDLMINPHGWLFNYVHGPQQLFMHGGKIGMYLYSDFVNEKIGLSSGRAVLFDPAMRRYEVLGAGQPEWMMTAGTIINQVWSGKNFFTYYVAYDGANIKYNAAHAPNDGEYETFVSGNSAVSDKWVIIMPRIKVNPDIFKTLYARVGEWKWQEISEGYDGYVYNTTIVGDKAMFYDSTTKESYLCDLSKTPQSVADCTRLGRNGEVATFAMFNRNDPSEAIYWVFKEGMPGTEFVLLDISMTPFTVKKSFNVPSTEPTFTRQMYPFAYDGTILTYNEEFLNNTGTNYDQKICFYRLDEDKTFCSRKWELSGQLGARQGFAAWDGGKYLAWQGFTVFGYYLRDMECYCKAEGEEVCPFPEYRSLNRAAL